MSEVAVFLAHQSLAVQAALYLAALAFLLSAGGAALVLLVGALDRLGEMITSDPEWQPRGEISKEEILLVIGVLIYGQLLVSFDQPLRSFAGVVGNVLFTSLMIAPIAGALLLGARDSWRQWLRYDTSER